MNVPVGKSTVAAWVAAIGGVIAAILTAWQDAPNWVPVVLAALSYVTLNVNGHDRTTQANALVENTPPVLEPEVVFTSDMP